MQINLRDFEATLTTFGAVAVNTTDSVTYYVKFSKYDNLAAFESDLWPTGVAAFDTAEKVVYVSQTHRRASHDDLIYNYDLPSTYQEDVLNGEIIYGFVTASGHFLNRAEMAYWVQSKFPELIKKPIENDRLNSSNIDWGKVIAKLNTLRSPQ